jgi:gamma-glutamylcyclotransferase (GGCT)/AIG2-like uncharacterized protein YtfP
VYGTLKRGHGNHNLLDQYNAVYIGDGYLSGYNMLHLGAFPAIYKTWLTFPPIKGEGYWVNGLGLAALDRLEGVAYGHYARELLQINNLGRCFVYTQSAPKEQTFACVRGNVWEGRSSQIVMNARPGTGDVPARPPVIANQPAVTYHAPVVIPPGLSPSKRLWGLPKEAVKK